MQTARIGRQHYVFGFNTSKRVTLSNNFINGDSPFSAGCNGYHYWTFEMVGKGDQITLQNNHIYHTSGRSPAWPVRGAASTTEAGQPTTLTSLLAL